VTMTRQTPARAGRELPYRPCVGIMLVNRDGLAFIGRRRADGDPAQAGSAYAWQMPQGGIDPGEDAYAAALRELYEETNVRSVAFLAEAPEWYDYDLPDNLAGRAWKGRYRGQTQKWFALRFTGADDEIDIRRPGGGRHRPEFDAWRWERIERLPGLIVPFKRPVYEKVVAAFGHLVVPGGS
jgi:putative (di)nucleoside polyphosphate hydrolase